MKTKLPGIFRLLPLLILLGFHLASPVIARGSNSFEVIVADRETGAWLEWGSTPEQLPHFLFGDLDPAECEESQEEERHFSDSCAAIPVWGNFAAHLRTGSQPVCERYYPVFQKRYLAFHCLRINC